MKYFILFIVSSACISLNAQTKNENLNEQLNTLKTAFMEKDYSVLADYTFPKLVEKMGGKEKMVETTLNATKKMESQGFIFKKITFTDASSFMEHNGDLQCSITQVLEMDTPSGKVQSKTSTIAISQDGGENWVFLDTSGMPRSSIETFYDNLHPDLEIKQGEKKLLD